MRLPAERLRWYEVFQTLKNAWKIGEIRNKMLFTLAIVLLYCIGSIIPVPYVQSDLLQKAFGATGSSLFAYFNLLSGNAFSRATLFALSVSPYITASIVIQLLTIAIPALERMSKEGEAGRKKLTQITRYVTIALSLVTSFGYYTYLRASGFLVEGAGVFHAAVIIACYSAGAAVIMWLAEKINDHGIGNGISIILFANIVTSLPSMAFVAVTNGQNQAISIIGLLILLVVTIAMVVLVVFVSNSERRLAVQYAKRQVGRKMYGGQSTHLPMKVIMSGVMPIIFANSIVAIPATIALMIPPKDGSVWYHISEALSYRSPIYAVLLFLLIIGFSYFYLTISFNAVEVANNLKKNGGFIPGIRPGKPTSDYIQKILNRVTLIGAIFLGIVSVVPLIFGIVNPNMAGLSFGGSSLLIVVGVVLETSTEIEAQTTMRHYKGFLE